MATDRIINSSEISSILYKELFFNFYGKSQELDDKIEKVYQEKFGEEFPKQLAGEESIVPTTVISQPGSGQIFAIKSALEQFGKDMGMNVHINPGSKFLATKDDLVLMSKEVSNAEKLSELDVPDMENTIKNAAGGIFLFDEMKKGALGNELLSMSENKHNPGEITIFAGHSVNDFSTPFLNRTRVLMTDKPALGIEMAIGNKPEYDSFAQYPGAPKALFQRPSAILSQPSFNLDKRFTAQNDADQDDSIGFKNK